MVVILIIRTKDNRVEPVLDGFGFLLAFPTIRDARWHFDSFKLHQKGVAKFVGIED
jgi:hypothetical protein